MTNFSLRHAYLFSHGMGFFLFEKELEDNVESFDITIKKKDLNDVLSSLMVYASSGSITSVAYSSDIKETIKDKYLANENYYNYVVKTFRGNRLKVSLVNLDQPVVGTLIGGEYYNSSFKKKKNIVEDFLILFDTVKNIILQVPFKLITNLEIVDSATKIDLQKALEVTSSQDEEETVLKVFYNIVSTKPNSKAIIGYTIPISLWKINYRIKIEESANEAFLDSFCIINNPLSEDWNDTEISLITGRPVAFTYNLNRTDKLERSLISPTNVSSIDPVSSEAESSFSSSSPVRGPTVRKGESTNGGIEVFQTEIDGVRTSIVKQSDLNLLRYNLLSNVVKLVDNSFKDDFQSVPMDTIFPKIISENNDFARMNLGQEYNFHIKGMKTIKGKENAIIPLFANIKLPFTKLLFFEYKGINDSPYTSIELFNTVDYPFENGPCVIFEDSTPVGESVLPTCFTSQSRIISYSKEPRVTISKLPSEYTWSQRKFSFLKKPLAVIEKYTKFELVKFKIISKLDENNEKNPSLLVIDYNHAESWKIVKEELQNIKVKVLERGYRFSIPLGKEHSFTIKLKFQFETSNEKPLQAITKSYFALFNDKITDEDIKRRFDENFRLLEKLEKLRAKEHDLSNEKNSIVQLIDRIRNNLKAIPESTGNNVRNNFVLKLNNFEDEIEKINNQINEIADQRLQISKELEALR